MRERAKQRSERWSAVLSTTQGAWQIGGNFVSRGCRRLFRSQRMGPQSSTHAFAMSDVLREDDVRSLAPDDLLAPGAHERRSLRGARHHLGIRMVSLPRTNMR